MAKMIRMEVCDVIRLTRGSEVIEFELIGQRRSRHRSDVGIQADRAWHIELFKGKHPTEKVDEKSD